MLDLYGEGLPVSVIEALEAPEMLRLQGVGMNCGCEYTAFPLFDFPIKGYSRYEHSEGVARIVWRFTGDARQAMAGLLHDVDTPAFAHVVDFLNGDHDRQESTERGTAAAIAASDEIREALRRGNLSVTDVCDYHRYPIADNPSPGLSADRLEYTLGMLWRRGFAKLEDIARLYGDLTVSRDEHGSPELAFLSAGRAVEFALLALQNSRLYVADEDRFSMQYLADMLRGALSEGAIAPADLNLTEREVIERLSMRPSTRERWLAFTRLRAIVTADHPGEGYWVRVSAKKRYIDPLVVGHGRASALSEELAGQIADFRALAFDRWIAQGNRL